MRDTRSLSAVLVAISLLSGCSETPPAPVGVAGTAGGGAAGGGAGGLAGGGAGGAGAGAGGGAGTGGTGGMVMPVGTDLGDIEVESVATWRGDADGAYTIIHDDICDYTIDSLFDIAGPELTMRGLRGAFGAIVSRCEERELWDELEVLRASGHEIINHTWDHKNLVDEAATAPLSLEVDQATQVLDANLVGQKTSFFIFPYDSFNDAAVQHLDSLGYLGARAGDKGVNDKDFPDGLRVMFDVYGGENSIYDGQGDILQIYVDLAISQGGWSVREFHGVADTTFFSMEVEAYRQHLDYAKSKVESGELWVDTPTAVVRYRFARQHCALPTASGYTVGFAAPSADCLRYAAPLSVVVTTAVDAPSVLVAQGGVMQASKKLGPSRFLIDIDPSLGPAAIGGGS